MAAADVVADMRSGQCLCGSVTYRAKGLRDIWYCHCRQCRYATGHFMAACRTEKDDLEWDGFISWSAHSGTSEIARCRQCGSPLFWRQPGSATISVVAGSLDDTDGIAVPGHIFTGEKGSYYAISDGLPQSPAEPEGGV
ncbi:GFA family protein [uncultured Erythrobacter sp.]|uniref:GFA family protein n=1 Tax=uncultured Erythrobacter sp. TaxID=263913 RepID=UPI00262EBFB8|nr:GFA family protein [uncultured Erythrobacter sp.]